MECLIAMACNETSEIVTYILRNVLLLQPVMKRLELWRVCHEMPCCCSMWRDAWNYYVSLV